MGRGGGWSANSFTFCSVRHPSYRPSEENNGINLIPSCTWYRRCWYFSLSCFLEQTYIIFLAKLKTPHFSPGPESSECRLFALDDIPFDSLAFSSMLVTLNLVWSVFGQLNISFFFQVSILSLSVVFTCITYAVTFLCLNSCGCSTLKIWRLEDPSFTMAPSTKGISILFMMYLCFWAFRWYDIKIKKNLKFRSVIWMM